MVVVLDPAAISCRRSPMMLSTAPRARTSVETCVELDWETCCWVVVREKKAMSSPSSMTMKARIMISAAPLREEWSPDLMVERSASEARDSRVFLFIG
jgi:hypothetical protein